MNIKQYNVFIFDPCFGNMTGHWENLCRRISDEFELRGLQTKIFCQKEINKDIVKSLNILPTFGNSPYVDISSKEKFLEEYKKFAADLAAIDITQFGKDDLLIFPTIFPQILLPVFEWIQKNFPNLTSKNLAIIFQFAAGNDKLDSDKLNFDNKSSKKNIKNLIKTFLAKLINKTSEKEKLSNLSWHNNATIDHYRNLAYYAKTNGVNCSYFASSSNLAKNFSLLFNTTVQALPMPAPISNYPEKINSDSYPDSPIVIGYFGHSSLAKGTQFLEAIIDKTLKEYRDCKFCLHINPNCETAGILEVFKQPRNNIICHYDHITQKHLLELIKSVDIVLMPYDPGKYSSTPSAIFTESIMLEKIVVIPANTWMENEANKVDAGYISYLNYNQEEIYNALKKAILARKLLQEKAKLASKKFCKYHNITNFINVIINTCKK